MVTQIGTRLVAVSALLAGLLASGVTESTAAVTSCTPILSSESHGASVLALTACGGVQTSTGGGGGDDASYPSGTVEMYVEIGRAHV